MSTQQYHFIYKTTCNITKRYYIGMHSTNNLDDGYLGSGKILWYSIKKYGKENHTCEILEKLSNRKLLREREKEIVNKELIEDDLCMNINFGGQGSWEYVNSNKLSPVTNHAKMTNEIFELFRQGWSKAGKQLQEWIKKNGNPLGFKGKHHSEQMKEKMRKIMKEKVKGNKNGAFGCKWIHDNQGNARDQSTVTPTANPTASSGGHEVKTHHPGQSELTVAEHARIHSLPGCAIKLAMCNSGCTMR